MRLRMPVLICTVWRKMLTQTKSKMERMMMMIRPACQERAWGLLKIIKAQ